MVARMTTAASTRPVSPRDPADREELEALIEEARQRSRRRRRRNAGFVVLATVLAVGAYFGIVRLFSDSGPAAGAPLPDGWTAARSNVQSGELAIFFPPSDATIAKGNVAKIETVDPTGSKTIWSCPRNEWCGQAVSHAWSPDGRQLALSLDEIGGRSGYAGLHVIDTATGQDRQIPSGAPAVLPADPNDPRFREYFEKLVPRLGCLPPSQLAWSPDGTKLAYPCGSGTAQTPGGSHFISILELNGSGHTEIHTPTNVSWPSWSADGKRIVYATGVRPEDRPSLYSVRVDGTHRTLLAKDGGAPASSPDGHTIAYQTACGIRLVTPAGADITPHPNTEGCDAIGLSGPPVWSPDGKQIAFETPGGIYAMNANGTQLRLVSHVATPTWYGGLPGRPSWRRLF